MLIVFHCEQCGAKYKVDESRVGQKGTCRHCGAALSVPVPPPPVERSPSGGEVLRHAERQKPFEVSIGDDELIEEISDHIERHVGPIGMVFHEIISDLVHIDVYHILPDDDRHFHTVITSGMSARPMTVPEGAEAYQYAELQICLPADWPVSMEAFKDENHYWPVRLMKELSRLPHEYDTWLGIGHTIPNGGDDPQPYAPNTKLCCAMIVPAVRFGTEFRKLNLSDGRLVNFYSIWPLYADEIDFKLQHGYDELVDRLLNADATDIFDIARPRVCRRKWWPFGK